MLTAASLFGIKSGAHRTESVEKRIHPPNFDLCGQAKGIPALVALLKSSSAAEAEAAAGAIGLLAESSSLKLAILDTGRGLLPVQKICHQRRLHVSSNVICQNLTMNNLGSLDAEPVCVPIQAQPFHIWCNCCTAIQQLSETQR